MNIDGVPLEMVDSLLGNDLSREAMERSAHQAAIDSLVMPDATGFSADTGVVREVETAHLVECFCDYDSSTALKALQTESAMQQTSPARGTIRKTVSRHRAAIKAMVFGHVGRFKTIPTGFDSLIDHCVDFVEQQTRLAENRGF